MIRRPPRSTLFPYTTLFRSPISPRHMPAEVKKEIELEIGHVLFIDIVAYSKLSVNEQHARIEELNEVVRSSEQFRKAQAANRILDRKSTRLNSSHGYISYAV